MSRLGPDIGPGQSQIGQPRASCRVAENYLIGRLVTPEKVARSSPASGITATTMTIDGGLAAVGNIRFIDDFEGRLAPLSCLPLGCYVPSFASPGQALNISIIIYPTFYDVNLTLLRTH